MLKKCPNCGANKLQKRNVERSRHVAGHAFTAHLPARVCAACKVAFFADEPVGAFDMLVAAHLAEAGVTSAEALRFMRKSTGMLGKEFAALLDVRPETVSRWEQGKRRIDRATYAIIRQLIWDRLLGKSTTADYLRSLHRPRRLPKKITIRLDRAA